MKPHASSSLHRGLRRLTTGLVASLAIIALVACTANNNTPSGSNSTSSVQPSRVPPLNFSVNFLERSAGVYNAYSPNFIQVQGLVLQRLALQQYPSLTKFEGRLADKWQIDGNVITVHLRAGEKWQDGTPVTAKDVMTTFTLNGINGDALFDSISSMKVVNASTFSVTVRNGVPNKAALSTLLGEVIYPNSVYGQFVTATLQQDVLSYYDQLQTDPTKANNSLAKRSMNAAFTKLSAFKPSAVIGNGPYALKSSTTHAAVLTKSSTYVWKDKIKVPSIDLINAKGPQAAALLKTQNLDFSGAGLTAPLSESLSRVQGYHVALVPSFMFIMAFNNHRGPTADVHVRQAIAYIVDRNAMIVAAHGSSPTAGGAVTKHPAGLQKSAEQNFLTAKQIDSLRTYPVDHAKASQLLTQAGYHKSGSMWVNSKGQPLTLSIEGNAAGMVTSFRAAASELTASGIKTTVTQVGSARMNSDLQSGNFEIAQALAGGYNPLVGYQAMLGSAMNFTTSGANKGKTGIGFGPSASVPGLGTVNVATTIDKQAATVAPGSKEMKKLTWGWARLVNQQLPYLEYGTKVYQYSYSSTHYTNWPPANDQTWSVMGANAMCGLVQAMLNGYVIPS